MSPSPPVLVYFSPLCCCSVACCHQPEPDSQLYQSSYQGNRQITLPDGSVLSLSGRTEVLVRFSAAQRAVQLHYGAAHFQVAKDSARPFVVTADQLQVRAVGTAFSVRREADIMVAVDECVVAVSSQDLAPMPPPRLQQGQQIHFSARHGFSEISTYHAASALSWRSGRLGISRRHWLKYWLRSIVTGQRRSNWPMPAWHNCRSPPLLPSTSPSCCWTVYK